MEYNFVCKIMWHSQYETIRRLMEEVVSERPIALAHVSSNILHDDIRYCTYHSHHSI
jgi:hypothetical protein